MLTEKQKSMLVVLIEHFAEHDVPPSFEELCDRLNLKSKSGVHRLLSSLEERGYIRRLPNRARAIEVLKKPDGTANNVAENNNDDGVHNLSQISDQTAYTNTTAIPLLGKIAAGTPIEAIRDTTNMVDLPAAMLGMGEYFALEIEGDSMIDAGIMDGDTVLIERCDTAPNGTIIVALIDNEEATLKKLRKKGESIALEAANPNYETRIFGPDRVQIQGKLAGLIRYY